MIYALIWVHFLADFVLQTDDMALNKSKDLGWLAIHCMVYLIPFVFFGTTFAIFAGLSHFVVDFFTSRLTSYLWQKEQRHWFFVTIGFDQAVHLSFLFWTIKFLTR